MNIREATIADIDRLSEIRIAVVENSLSDPTLLSTADYTLYLTKRGKGWICEEEGKIVGFAIVDLLANNVWALFVDPMYEKRGIGRQLHRVMLNWYFDQTQEPLWLGTDPGTRAEDFYRRAGWMEIGIVGSIEIKFEMRITHWDIIKHGE
jgi:GNAT superfamily N-acetyltransferase